MEVLEFIFRLGIIFIVFSLVWGFFLLLFRLAVGLRPLHPIEDYAIKLIHLYILCSISAMQTLAYLTPTMPAVTIVVFGLLTLYFYLTGRLERNRMTIKMNNQVFTAKKDAPDMRVEMLFIFIGLFYYSMAITNENIVNNNLNVWFFKTVMDLYDTPLLKWIFGFIGIIFLINMIMRSFIFTNNLINTLMGNKPNRNNDDDNHFNSNNDDDYTDYEVVDDDKLN